MLGVRNDLPAKPQTAVCANSRAMSRLTQRMPEPGFRYLLSFATCDQRSCQDARSGSGRVPKKVGSCSRFRLGSFCHRPSFCRAS